MSKMKLAILICLLFPLPCFAQITIRPDLWMKKNIPACTGILHFDPTQIPSLMWTCDSGGGGGGTITLAGDVDGSSASNDLDELAVESELENVLDLQDLQGAVTDSQVPNNITIDLATAATSLAADGSNCSPGNYPLGVDAQGNAQSCTAAGGGTTPSGTGFRHVTAGVEDAASVLVDLTSASQVAANQGTTSTVLHGNAAGQASFAAVALGTDTSGNYVKDVADGTGIDGTASGVGATYTPTLDLTEITCTAPVSCPAATTLTTTMNTARLIGRTTASAGVMEEITVGSPLTLSAGALDIANIADSDLANNYSGVGACGASTWASTLNDNAAPTCTQPAFTDISGSLALAQLTDDGTSGKCLLSGGAGGDPAWTSCPGGGSTPTGTGYRHVTSGVEDAAADLVTLTSATEVAANQGTTTTVLHGNAAGQASWATISPSDMTDGTTVTPSQITSDQNDYAPTGIGSASTLLLSSDASGRAITGIDSTGSVHGRRLTLISSGFPIDLTAESASSSAANRIYNSGFSGHYTIDLQGIELAYDTTLSMWKVLSGSGSYMPAAPLSAKNYVFTSQGISGLTYRNIWKQVPDCTDASGNHINYTESTNTFSCGTSLAAHKLLSPSHADTSAASAVLGDIIYANSSPAWTKLAGNTTTTKKILTQTGNGSVSAAPAWGLSIITANASLNFGDPSANTCTAAQTITLTGAVAGDPVILGIPGSITIAQNQFFPPAWVSAADTVSIKFCEEATTTNDPAAGTFTVTIIK